jgi:hypothetical protein
MPSVTRESKLQVLGFTDVRIPHINKYGSFAPGPNRMTDIGRKDGYFLDTNIFKPETLSINYYINRK